MSRSNLMNEYAICKERGHEPDYDISDPLKDGDYSKEKCKFCKTIFWTEEVLHERFIPKIKPEIKS